MNGISPIYQTQTMTSLQIAEVTGKRHCDVISVIYAMEYAWAKISGRYFALAEHIDELGRPQPCYLLSKAECLYIATRFNDEAWAKLVLHLEQLEKENSQRVPTSFKEALLLLAEQQEKIEQQQRLLLEQRNQIAERDLAISELHKKINNNTQKRCQQNIQKNRSGRRNPSRTHRR